MNIIHNSSKVKKPQMIHIHWSTGKQTVEYYLAMKRNEVSLHAKTKMNLEKTMLRERSQSQKATYPRKPRINKTIETESR